METSHRITSKHITLAIALLCVAVVWIIPSDHRQLAATVLACALGAVVLARVVLALPMPTKARKFGFAYTLRTNRRRYGRGLLAFCLLLSPLAAVLFLSGAMGGLCLLLGCLLLVTIMTLLYG